MIETIRMLGISGVFAVGLQIADIVTDYIYAVDLITSYNDNDSIQRLGYISLFAAIMGLLLFLLKMLLMRKLIGHQVQA